jgi:hypothetical protein
MTQAELTTQVQNLKNSFEDAQISEEEFKELVYGLFEQAKMQDVYQTYCDLNLQPILKPAEANV